MLPCWSPSTWISMWRGCLDELLDEHAVVAEAVEAFALGRLEALAHVLLGPGARRMPLPPPPADAFIITG